MHRAASYLRWLLWSSVGLCTLLAVTTGPSLDDYVHREFTANGAWFTLYDFFDSQDPSSGRLLGHMPWWAAPDFGLRFFRPSSSFLLAVDHHLLDGGGVLSHLHGLFWYAVLLVIAGRLLRRLVGPTGAGLATAHYAIANWHTFPLAFIAARHVHITAVFALLTFELTLRAVEEDSRLRWFALFAFGLALLAGESALLVLPVLFASCLARHGIRKTTHATAPLLVSAFVYVIAYAALGYGAKGSGLYLSPGSPEFFSQLPVRWLTLVADLLGSIANDAALLGASLQQCVWGLLSLLATTALLLFGIRPTFRQGLPAGAAPAIELMALIGGALVSLIAASAAMPGGRSLVVVGVATSALFGSTAAFCSTNWHTLTRLRKSALCGWLLVFGLGAHPLFRTLLPLDLRRLGEQSLVEARLLSERCADRTVFALGTPTPNVYYFPYALDALGLDSPRAIHVLSMAPGEHDLSQRGPDDYRLTINGDFFASPWSLLHRGTSLHVGESAQLLDAEVHLTDTEPTTLDIRLTEPGQVCWATTLDGRLQLFDPPRRWVPKGQRD